MKTILWKGFFEGNTGYINCSKKYPLALEEAGMDVGIVPLRPLSEDNEMKRLVKQEGSDTFTILHQVPSQFPGHQGYYTVTEFDLPPPEWWIPISKADVLLTQSKFCKNIFGKIPGIDKDKIHVVNFPIDETMNPTGEVVLYDKQYDFLFGSCFEWVARKKPELMWEAFINEFPIEEYPNVGFINKMSPYPALRNWKHLYNKYTYKDSRIHLFKEHLNDIGAFYRSLNCYCSPSAGEGWGATMSEAMLCGVPVIGSRHSGNLDFMNDKNSYLVETKKWTHVGNDQTNKISMVYPFQRWKLPKVSSIQKQMRIVYEESQNGSPKKVQEALKIRKQFSLKVIGQQLKKALEPLI